MQRPAEVDVAAPEATPPCVGVSIAPNGSVALRVLRTSSSACRAAIDVPVDGRAHMWKNAYVPLPWLGSMLVSTMKPQPAWLLRG